MDKNTENGQKFNFKNLVTLGQLIGFAAASLIALTGFGAWQGATNERLEKVANDYTDLREIVATQTKILEQISTQNKFIVGSIKRHESKLDEYNRDIKEFYKQYKLETK